MTFSSESLVFERRPKEKAMMIRYRDSYLVMIDGAKKRPKVVENEKKKNNENQGQENKKSKNGDLEDQKSRMLDEGGLPN